MTNCDIISIMIDPTLNPVRGFDARTTAYNDDPLLSPEARDWAESELAWKYDYITTEGTELLIMSDGEGDVYDDTERYTAPIERLYQAKLALLNSSELTPSGKNIGEAMNLVAVPWKAFRDNLDRLPDLVESIQYAYGNAVEDLLLPDLDAAILDGSKIYRNPIAGLVTTTSEGTQVAPDWISPAVYLDYRISQDGNWGLMLVQTSKEAGLKRLLDGPEEQRSPDALTNGGHGVFMLEGLNVGQLGIFEWLALSMYVEDPSELSLHDFSWMLANRVETSSGARVPLGCYNDGQLVAGLQKATRENADTRPRLTYL